MKYVDQHFGLLLEEDCSQSCNSDPTAFLETISRRLIQRKINNRQLRKGGDLKYLEGSQPLFCLNEPLKITEVLEKMD